METRIQRFEYKNFFYNYRITAPALRTAKREIGCTKLSVYISRSHENVIKVLYYLVCWNGFLIDRNKFVNDWKAGKVYFFHRRKYYNEFGIYRLISKAIVKFKIDYEYV